jgi:tRNA/tmRNA/rRNA uracil-C5-methylase (TrmA/RlmC/RlmD family)
MSKPPRKPAQQRRRDAVRSRQVAVGRDDDSFAKVVLSKMRRLRSAEHEPLAHLSYGDELALKQAALREVWRRRRLDGTPEDLVPSPRPRGYRTSSKRRVTLRDGRVFLFLGERLDRRQRSAFVASELEPEQHTVIYRALSQRLAEPGFRALAGHLNYLVVRGSYAEPALILNVDELDAKLVRKIKLLAGRSGELPLAGCFAYLDPTRSTYHFESRRPDRAVTFKKIFGRDYLAAAYHGCRYRYHPTSFSQVNESVVPDLMLRARQLLAPERGQHLLDLYCGYGLFSHYLAPDYAGVLGVELDAAAVRAAADNIRLNPGRTPRRFVAARIDRELVSAKLPRPTGREVILLDPPRNGPQHGVIPALGRRAAEKVLHVFCDVDQIPGALQQWRSVGYRPSKIVPLDMFPGTANLEVLVLLTRSEHARRH